MFKLLSMKGSTRNSLRHWLAEALGTFMIVFTGTGAIVIDETTGGSVTHIGISLTFGLIVLAMIYALGDISGAHLNPAVTIGFWASRRFPGAKVIPYILSQCVGALAASVLLRILFADNLNLGATNPVGSAARTFILEAILTFLLMFVVLCVSAGSREKGLMAGIAVGSVIALEALFAGPISGASMNPARSLAPALVSGKPGHVWIYIVSTILGSLIAVAVAGFLLGESSSAGDEAK